MRHHFSLLALPLLASFAAAPEVPRESGAHIVGPSAWMNARAKGTAVLCDLRSSGRPVPGTCSPARFSPNEKRAIFLLGEPAICVQFATSHALQSYFVITPAFIEYAPLPGVPQLSPREAHLKIQREGWPLFDISEAQEFASSRLPRSQRLAYASYERSPQLPPRGKPFVVACRVGLRSQLVVQKLRKLGFDAYNLNGGLWAWECAGLPLESGS